MAHVDAILCVGDLVDGEGDVDRVVSILQASRVLTVRGNRDRWLLEDRLRDLPGVTLRSEVAAGTLIWLAGLPPTADVETAEGRLLLCHGVAGNDMRRLLPDDSDYALEANDELQSVLRDRRHAWMVCGHTHQRMVRDFGRLTAVNPGALSATEEPGFAVLDVVDRAVVFHDLRGP